jgi:hypothetical protein
MEHLAFQVSEGNPGACAVIFEAMALDTANLAILVAWGVKGGDLWIKYKECNKVIAKLLEQATDEVRRAKQQK